MAEFGAGFEKIWLMVAHRDEDQNNSRSHGYDSVDFVHREFGNK